MGLWALFLIAVGLSMDAFAASICLGLDMPKPKRRRALVVGLFFGGFQALMPILGWLLGRSFEVYIQRYDHWIAFFLLAFIGGKTLLDTFSKGEKQEDKDAGFGIKRLFLLAIATSIDALAVGVTFAFLNVNIVPSACLIGATTFTFSFAGVWIGDRLGAAFKNGAQRLGGVILICIGIKILLEHLGLIGF